MSRRAGIVALAFLLPTLVAVADALGFRLPGSPSLIPLSILGAAIILMWGITSSHLLHPISRAQSSVIDSLNDPVILASPEGDLLYRNSAALALANPGNTLASAYPDLLHFLPVGEALVSSGRFQLDGIEWSVQAAFRRDDSLDPGILVLSLHNISRLAAQAAELEIQVRQRTAELEQALGDKELLLRELHHRVKNNLQIIISLLKLQSNRIQDQPEIQALCSAMVERVKSISMVHDLMHRESFHGGLDFGAYVTELVKGTAVLFSSRDSLPPIIRIPVGRYRGSVDFCVDLGLAINELVTNAFKHAILPLHTRLETSIEPLPKALKLLIRDHGPGIDLASPVDPSKLGLKIIRSIIRKYDVVLTAGQEGGAWIRLDIPVSPDGLQVIGARDEPTSPFPS